VAAGLLLTALWSVPLRAADGAEALTATPLAPRSGPRTGPLFVEVPPDQSQVRTENAYADPRMWGELSHEFEIGAIGTGVTIGDYDGDGRPDIFVVSKTESSRLFRNLGEWRFEDVSEPAGVADRGAAAAVWKQGATFADVNNDGWLDLYVCRFNAPNLLYINQGDGTFREEARAYGLDLTDASSMAAFCDYDRDGWLDVYVQTNLLNNATSPGGQRDHLLRNNGDGTFTNVTEAAGLNTRETQGNSATWWDFNEDGWPDLYVANDFALPDWLYRNNGDGTFTNVVDEVVPHVTYSSMGSDLGDVNNDGRIDFLATDMAATTHEKDQRAMADPRGRSRDPDESSPAIPNYLRNALYLNTGVDRMLEAAQLAGLAATDWTWSVRWEDLDNDGRLDLHITNGMHREIHNTDLILRRMNTEGAADRIRVSRNSPVLAESNLAFRNRGDLVFESVGAEWGLDQKGVSFGAAYGDLDGDGDLDVVYTNYQAGATLLRNDSQDGHRVIVALQGEASNRFGVGARVHIETASGPQVRQLVLARGHLSSSEPVLHFGLGTDPVIERLTVSWPSGHEQQFEQLAVDHRYTIREPAGPVLVRAEEPPAAVPSFAEVGQSVRLAWRAGEERIDELAQQHLLPVRTHRRGPALAVGDVDGDGRDDVVLGGTKGDPARWLRNTGAGGFSLMEDLIAQERGSSNDGPVLIFDANGDGRMDGLITKGGSRMPAGSSEYQPRLFWGTENGFALAAPDALPPVLESLGAAVAADFDRDGKLDVFLGARVSPGLYPLPPRSFLLRNRGDGFDDVTDTVAPGLREVGMVTSALWSDVDRDGWPDLLLTLEWGHVRVFRNDGGRRFEDVTEHWGFAAAGTGWWTSIASADFNQDGRFDYVVGNVGLNTPYRAEPERPAVLFVHEPPEGGALRLIEGYYEGDTLYPRRSRRELGTILPAVLRRFPRNDLYARAPLEQVATPELLAAAHRFEATELRSGVFLSEPDGTYRFTPLPRIAQIAPLQGIVTGDFDGDGRADIYAVQNSYAPTPVVGRFDGGLSQLLRGDGAGGFVAVEPATSGLVVPGDAKALIVLDWNDDGWPDLLVSRNNDFSLAFQNRGWAGRHPLRVTLEGPRGNPTAVGAFVQLELADGARQLAEVQAGGGWASQSSAACFFGYTAANPPTTITVRWPDGRETSQPVPAEVTSLRLVAP
jgi:enediyne biosynthesis protein E4